jgi:hypothetical protein
MAVAAAEAYRVGALAASGKVPIGSRFSLTVSIKAK